jgi:hypothetical protein
MKELTVGRIGAGKETSIEIFVEQAKQEVVLLGEPEPLIVHRGYDFKDIEDLIKYAPNTGRSHKSRSGNKGNKKQSKARAKSKRARKARKKQT